jgi:hypothetical protein
MLPGTAHQQPRPLPPPSSSVIDWPRVCVCVCTSASIRERESFLCVCWLPEREREREKSLVVAILEIFQLFRRCNHTTAFSGAPNKRPRRRRRKFFLEVGGGGYFFDDKRNESHTHTHLPPPRNYRSPWVSLSQELERVRSQKSFQMNIIM